jgi:tetratricopeptide (TPR) repeat protein
VIDTLRAELERLFNLDELKHLATDLLGVDPERVGGTLALASFAKSLTEHAAEHDRLEALVDAVLASKPDAATKLASYRAGLPDVDELTPGDLPAGLAIVRTLAETASATIALGRYEGHEVRVRILRREALRDRRALERYLVQKRVLRHLKHASLPADVTLLEHAGRWFELCRFNEGQSWAARISRTGPMHLNEARTLLVDLLSALSVLHARGLTHGDVNGEAVHLARLADGSTLVELHDAAVDRLRMRNAQLDRRGAVLPFTAANPRTVAPEILRGQPSTPRSDVYGFGALLYEVLTGKPVFGEGFDAAVGHLALDAPAPSVVAPRGWVSRDVDQFVLSLLAKDPAKRPAHAGEVLGLLERVGKAPKSRGEARVAPEALEALIEKLVAAPLDEEAALALESSIDDGADPARVADAFQMAAETVEGDSAEARDAQRRLLLRAGRLLEGAQQLERAEALYQRVVALDPSSGPALAQLENVLRRAGKYEALVEMLLERSEKAESRSERARALAEIGRVYAQELDDTEQALVAYAQAFCEDAQNTAYADEVERLAGADPKAWEEVLSTCVAAVSEEELPVEIRNLIYCRMADWYLDRVERPDLALPVYQAVLQTEPASDAALLGLTHIYRKAQQWPELGMVLTTRAAAAATPSKARDLRCEAAEILEVQMGDANGARALYQEIADEDPGHRRASDALARIYERTGDPSALAALLLRRAEAERGEEKQRLLCRVAELYEKELGSDDEATLRYRSVLELDDANLDALRGLDRLYAKAGRYRELLENLQRQIQLAATPRQKIALWERVAAIYDAEYLDHASAASAWEAVLDIDSSHDRALDELPRHYRALGRWEELAALLARRAELVSDPAKQLELRLAEGRVLSDQVGSPDRAMAAFERALELDPNHGGALEALARLREVAGDSDAALSAVFTLAEQATTPSARAEHYVRAAKLLESRGDRDGAIEQFKRALDQTPEDVGIAAALRAAYVARGDVNAAIQLLDKELLLAEGDALKARLSAEMAVLARDRLKDDERAEGFAKRAVQHDPAHLEARVVLGDIAFENGRYLEASRHYEVVAGRADGMSHERAARLLVRYVDALSQTGSTEKALVAMDTLARIAPNDLDALARVAQVTLEHGSAKRAVELYGDLFARGGALTRDPRQVLRFGQAKLRAGDAEGAVKLLEQAVELDPTEPTPLTSLAEAHESLGNWSRVLDVKSRALDSASAEARLELLMDIGDIASARLGDRTRAAKAYVAALEERPDDRRLLTKLMQLYSEEQDWEKLVDVVLRLAEFVDDKLQQAKYLQTAAIVCSRQLKDYPRALGFYRQVIERDPTNEKALAEAVELERGAGRFQAVAELLEKKLSLALDREDTAKAGEAAAALALVYERDLNDVDRAVAAYERAQQLDGGNAQRAEKLTELYAAHSGKYFDKAVAAQLELLAANPYRPDSYKLLRRLYTERKKADAAWCLCQALGVLSLAEPDEERFYRRMRSDTAAPAREALDDELWLNHLFHEDIDPLVTGIFALIEPALINARSPSVETLGYDEHYRIDLARHPYPMSQNLFYASGVLGLEPPPTYENPNDPAGLSFLHAREPSIVLGRAAMASQIPPQAGAFIAARHLAYFRPGLYVRQLVPTGTGLKSWLFAAIKLISPQFPVAPELEGPVRDGLTSLEAAVTGALRDQLARLVSRLLQSGKALDLKRWVAGVDATADRVGLVVAHDLETAVEIIQASDDSTSSVPREERLKQLVLFSVSPAFFELRRRLGIAIDS